MSQPRQAFRAATAEDLRVVAREQFLREGRIDCQDLAKVLGVARSTVYRWAGNADLLVGEVLADVAEANFHRAVAGASGSGAERILDAMERGMRAIATSQTYRRFLERDPHKALRLAASKDGPAQSRMVALHQRLLEEEVERGTLTLPVSSHTMAYALVRTAESFIYADLIAGERPDVAEAVTILRLLLR